MQFCLLALGACVAAVVQATGQNHVKMASVARLDLQAEPAVGSIDDGHFTTGDGSVDRMSWRPPAEQTLGYTLSCPVNHLGWTAFTVQFKPRRDGRVTVTLMGPWEQVSAGTLYQQELLWDAVTVSGATLTNGGFEDLRGTAVVGWSGSSTAIQEATSAVPSVEGLRVARTWHNRTLAATIRVTGNRLVTISFQTRAVVPPGYREMPRILSRDTRAHTAAPRFLRGTNLGNYLEAPPNQDWQARYSPADFQHIRAEGFDHVRLPIAWHHHVGPAPDFTISAAIYAKADFLVDEAQRRELAVIVNVHHFDAFTTDPIAEKPKLLAIWRQLAKHYAKRSAGVAFELLNEPKDAATTAVLNPIFAELIREIRVTNPERTIFVGPGQFNQVRELQQLWLPETDRNLIVTVHCYDPFRFTHQGASWAGADARLTGIEFPGPPARPLVVSAELRVSAATADWITRYNNLPRDSNPSGDRAFRGTIQRAKQWSEYYGRPVHVGEFGAYVKADAGSRARFYAQFRACLDEAGIGWAMWDWKAGFRYWDDASGQPAPGMREALFPSREPTALPDSTKGSTSAD